MLFWIKGVRSNVLTADKIYWNSGNVPAFMESSDNKLSQNCLVFTFYLGVY